MMKAHVKCRYFHAKIIKTGSCWFVFLINSLGRLSVEIDRDNGVWLLGRGYKFWDNIPNWHFQGTFQQGFRNLCHIPHSTFWKLLPVALTSALINFSSISWMLHLGHIFEIQLQEERGLVRSLKVCNSLNPPRDPMWELGSLYVLWYVLLSLQSQGSQSEWFGTITTKLVTNFIRAWSDHRKN